MDFPSAATDELMRLREFRQYSGWEGLSDFLELRAGFLANSREAIVPSRECVFQLRRINNGH
jgi:hypothetical protein